MRLSPFQYVECDDLTEAVHKLGEYGDDARLIAGGTVIVPLMKHDLLRPDVLVSIERVPGLDEIIDLGTHVRVGALVRHHDATRSPTIQRLAPLLSEACGRVASPVIRSMGTIGGNLCYGESASDPSPALLTLGARINVLGSKGERSIPINQWFLGFYETAIAMDEIVTSVDVPRTPEGAAWVYFKWTPRAKEDKPLIGLAAMLVEENGSWSADLAVGGVAPRPVALTASAAVLTGSDLSDRAIEDAAEAAANEVDAVDDLQGSSEYRRDMLRVWMRRVIRDVRDNAESRR